MLQEVSLLTPEYTTDIEVAKDWVIKEGKLVLGRKQIHTQGLDIRSPNQRAWQDSDFWCLLIPNAVHEWRFHIFNGKSIHRQRKVHTDTSKPWNFILTRS